MADLPSYINEDQLASDVTLKGNSFNAKIGYNKRAAAKRDLEVILQDTEGTPLTDETGNPLVAEIEGFVTTELTTDKALSVTFPTETKTVSRFFTILFAQSFNVVRSDAAQGIPDPYVDVFAPEGAYRFIGKGSRIEIATGSPTYEPDPNNPGQIRINGNNFETFNIEAVNESYVTDANGDQILRVRYTLNVNPTNENPITYLRRVLEKQRSGIIKIEEQFASTSEVSTTLLGIDRAETQLGLFSNVSTYGLNDDEFVFYTDNPSTGPGVWSNRTTEEGYTHIPAAIEAVKNEGALRITSFPVPYNFPYPPLSQVLDNTGTDIFGLYNPNLWFKWQNFLALGKSLYEYYQDRRDAQQFSADPASNYQKYDQFLTRFIPAINEWDDRTYYDSQFYNNNTDKYYTQIAIWTATWRLIVSEEISDPVSGVPLGLPEIQNNITMLRGTGRTRKILNPDYPATSNTQFIDAIGYGSVESVAGVVAGKTDLNPFKENWLNRTYISASTSGDLPGTDDFQPGYNATGGQFALLQSRQAFRYQPGRISGYTFGTRAVMDKGEGDNYAEWGIFNDFDEYVFRREGANFYIVRRSTIHYPEGQGGLLQELGLADENGIADIDNVTYYNKVIEGTNYTFQEIKLSKEKFNGDSLNGNGPSGYLLNTDEITMYKIEFGWYGAIGLRMYAYVPVDNGEARWVVVHTFVIENKLKIPSMGDPFFRFKYEMRIGPGRGPGLTEPQVLYKYGTSMYIDGGDEGTVNVYSETSDEKTLTSSGEYTSIFAIYPKNAITSGGGVDIPNKKIIIPKQMSLTADGFAEVNVVKCKACQGSSYLYMPNATAGTFGDIRKLYKLPNDSKSSDVTLAPIYITTSTAPNGSNTITTTDGDVLYLRAGDYLLDTDSDGNLIANVTPSRITSITENAGTYTITVQDTQLFTGGTTVTFQPTFIVGDTVRREFDLDYDDFQAKLITTRMWNTYLGDQVSGSYSETTNLLCYREGDRHNLDTERYLDPSRIVQNQTDYTPATFFVQEVETLGEATFEVRLSQLKTIIASPNAVNGPISATKFLNPILYEPTGQVRDWKIGYTPNKPLFGVTGELTGWQRPDGTLITEDRNGIPTNVILLPDYETVYLDYHPYSESITYTGFETGESWRNYIHPFRDDFRIGNPRGSNSGLCSSARLTKNDPISRPVTQTDSTTLGTIPIDSWTGFTAQGDLDAYLQLSTYFLTSTVPIIAGATDPTNGQLAAYFPLTASYQQYFYDNQLGNNPTKARFAGPQQQYSQVGQDGQQEIIYVIPVNIDIYGSYDAQGNALFSDPEFQIAYNSVVFSAWFSQGDRYDTPNSFSVGPGSDGIFEFNIYPLYAFFKLRDGANIRCAELHDIDLLGNVSTFNPQWKYNFIDGDAAVTYNAGTNLQTGELDVNGAGSITQTPAGIDDLVPSAFTQVSRLSSSQLDRQGESLLRPGNTLTTLYINNETKTFDLTDVFGFDRKVITPDILNTEAVYFVARALDPTGGPVSIKVNLTYVEQL